MSSHRPYIVLTKLAQRDYRGIQSYTMREWGAEQADRYMDEIDAAIERLRDNPQIGRLRFDLRSKPLCFPVNRHILYYRIRSDVIEISRILHERADPTRHL